MVAVIGAGPAGLFAARKLAEAGVRVVLLNRDIKPGGLAEYGIYPDKLKMKQGLRNQFRQILASENIVYYGNVTVCCGGNISLEDLLESGFHAVVVATGAQGTKWLRMPGENLPGVYHAKNIVFHYNQLPPFSTQKYLIGKKVAIVGAGNVMMDIAHYLVRERKVDEVVAVVRRGPADVKFTKKEMETVSRNLDLAALDAEFARVTPILEAVGQDAAAAKKLFTDALLKGEEPVSQTRLRFEFLASPVRVLGDWMHGIHALKVEENTLAEANGVVKPRGLGISRQIEADTVIFAIGDTVDEDFCLPTFNHAYVAAPEPGCPVDEISYEAYNPDANHPLERVFLAGWARQASTGLVGVARKDGENAARAVLQFLESQPGTPEPETVLGKFKSRLEETHRRVVDKERLRRLELAEQEKAAELSLEDFKFTSNDEMFDAMEFSDQEHQKHNEADFAFPNPAHATYRDPSS